jgi:hypothetical protein
MDEQTKNKLIGRFKNSHTANVKRELIGYGEMEDCSSMIIYWPLDYQTGATTHCRAPITPLKSVGCGR